MAMNTNHREIGSLDYHHMLDIVNGRTQVQIDEYLKTDIHFDSLVNLSSQRANILSVCDLKNTYNCLEISSGCGALSTFISSAVNSLDCIEVDKNKAAICELRNKNKFNINVYVDTFKNVELTKKYDVIFINYFEIEAKLHFPNEEDPYKALLTKASSVLSTGGVIYISLFNKYAIKYFAGHKEEYSDDFFTSIVGKTDCFSKNEITDLLKECNLSDIYFYYPLPNHLFANSIYSDMFLPKYGEINNIEASYISERYSFFSDADALNEAIKSGYFETFTNSYFIKCR